jgi:DNA-binding response OmpR family regulator
LLCDSLKDWGYEVDYIKDFLSITEQMAKIQALIRRTYTFQKQNNMIEHHGLILLIDENAISYNGQKVDLTKNEFKILELLLKNKGCPISKKDLMIKLWNNDCFVSDNTLFVNIARLRKTLKNIGLPELIVTKKGIGYMVNE